MTDAPKFIFIAPVPRSSAEPPASLCDAWRSAVEVYFGTEGNDRFNIIQGKLHDIDPNLLQCDCMVSPANSFGIMDGGYDYDLSRALMGSSHDFFRLTHVVQSSLRTRWGGYAPPTSCTLVPLPLDVSGAGRNPWSARILAVVPTMRIPEEVVWHKDLVYNSMWTLLAEISAWNSTKPQDEHIKRVVMSGFGTGVGKVKTDVCAKQMVLAVKHWMHPLPPEPEWTEVEPRAKEVRDTYPTALSE